jgi:hypothetical protein
MSENLPDPEREAVLQSLRQLETRIARLEAHLGMPIRESLAAEGGGNTAGLPPGGGDQEELEQRIGEYGLAWAGSIVSLLGFVFLMTYTLNQGYSLLSAAMGYAVASGVFILARIWQRSYFYLSRILVSASLLLGYYTTLRLHYYAVSPLIENRYFAFILVLLFAMIPYGIALRIGSQVLAGLPVFLVLLSALLGDAPHVTLLLAALQALLAVYLALRRDWWRLLNLTIVLVYLTHILWLINNPCAGHPLRPVAAGQYPPVYLFLCAAIFAWPTLFFDREATIDVSRVGIVFLNCLGCSAVLGFAAVVIFPQELATIALAACTLLLACSVLQWLKTREQFAATVYACFSYMALSIAIYKFSPVPDAFVWLALQSFLVVSMALWFRSRTLVVVNAAIYFGMLIAYWISSPLSDLVNFCFAVVALLSARVMNWKKERLTLRTDGLRNLYLAATFVMVLYALYHAVPATYVALSWTATAVGYFLLSLLLKNVKYRWMSLFNLLATVLYLFLVDLARLEPGSRVSAFLVLGLMAVGISLFYARLRRSAAKQSRQ